MRFDSPSRTGSRTLGTRAGTRRRWFNTIAGRTHCIAWLFCCASALAEIPSNHERLADSASFLSDHGVKLPTTDDPSEIAAQLRPLLVNNATLEKTLAYLTDLKSDDYGKRETASRELAKMRVPIDPLLTVPTDPAPGNQEFTWRLQQILAVRRSLALEDQLYHALIVIAERPVPGLISELLSTARALDGGDARLLAVAEAAIAATVTSSDTKLLRACAAAGHSRTTQKRATVALARLLSASDTRGLEELLATPDTELQLAAAEGASLAGNRLGLSILVSLLESRTISTRCHAAKILYESTGLDFGFAGYDDVSYRASCVAKWKQWLENHPEGWQSSPPDTLSTGRVIVGIQLKEESTVKEGRKRAREKYSRRSNVVEFTPLGSLRWHMRSTDLRGGTAIAAAPMRNGIRAIAFGKPDGALQHSMSVRFFNDHGSAIGSLSGIAGMPIIESTPTGNLLVTAANEVVELGPAGNLVGRMAFSTPLESIDHFSHIRGDRFLITSSHAGTVREYLKGGRLVFETGPLLQPVFARRAQDGSLLVGQADQSAPALVSYSADGRIQWTFSPSNEIGKMRAVAGLSNGNALFGSSTGLYEIGNGGRIARTWINGSVSFIYAD